MTQSETITITITLRPDAYDIISDHVGPADLILAGAACLKQAIALGVEYGLPYDVAVSLASQQITNLQLGACPHDLNS